MPALTGDGRDWLVVTDSGVYDSYTVEAYRCTAEQAKRLNTLRKEIARMIRQKRYPPHWTYGDSQPLYLTYRHEHVRLIAPYAGQALWDSLIGDGTGIEQLLAQYERDVASAPKEASK